MIKPEAKSFVIKTVATWEEKRKGSFITTEWKEPLPFSCPPVFGGTNHPSPEDLFLAAVATCTLSTILQLCDSLRTEPETLKVTTSAEILFNTSKNDYEFSTIKCKINISGDVFLLQRVCDLIPKYCIIGKHIKPAVNYEIKIEPAS
ncbi:MAG: OsmC family protein [Promethearchaeota archaeon]